MQIKQGKDRESTLKTVKQYTSVRCYDDGWREVRGRSPSHGKYGTFH